MGIAVFPSLAPVAAPCDFYSLLSVQEPAALLSLSAVWRWVLFLQLVPETSSSDCTVIRGDWGSL